MLSVHCVLLMSHLFSYLIGFNRQVKFDICLVLVQPASGVINGAIHILLVRSNFFLPLWR
jgi:hypothetical protein